MKRKPNRKTVRAAIRASVPDAKLRKARIVLSDAAPNTQAIGGFTEYERESGRGDVIKLGAPASDDSWSITVRGHETRHATRHKPRRKKPMTENEALASQIVDDVNIEMTSVPEVKYARPYRRAHLATAMRDLRTIVNKDRMMKRGELANDGKLRNAQLLCGLRVKAMLASYGQGDAISDEVGTRYRGNQKLTKVIGDRTNRALNTVMRLAMSSRTRNRAVSVLLALMESEESAEEEREETERLRDSDILEPVIEGNALDGHMKITDLRPKSVFCAKEKSITRKHAPDGVHLNPARFVNAIVSGESHGLFSRRVRQKPGGTVLIDASGSMGVNAKNLSALCELLPTATVGYYSGTGAGRGELCVYAMQGKRFAGSIPEETIHGGNAVDLPATRWMMKLPKPWHFVTDMQFCGGVLGSETVAKALIERAKERGDLTVYGSLDAAYEAFGGKGELKNW